MVILHGLIKTFKFELYLIIVLSLLLLRFTLMLVFVAEFYTWTRGKGR